MHFVLQINDKGRVAVKEAGDGTPGQRWAIVGFLEEHPVSTLLRIVDHVRRFEEVRDGEGEWGASGNTIGISVTAEGVELEGLFNEDERADMSHGEFIELVETYVRALRDAGDPRADEG